MKLTRAFVASSKVGSKISELEKLGLKVLLWNDCKLPTQKQVLYELDKNKEDVLVKIGTDNLLISGQFLEELFKRGVKVIASRSAGLNLIDLQKCSELKIPVVYSPIVPSVSEYAISLLLSLIRNQHNAVDIVKRGEWGLRELDLSDELSYSGKTLSVIGVGKIGKSFTVKAMGFGFDKILLHDISPDYAFLNACRHFSNSVHEISEFVTSTRKKKTTQIEYVDRNTALSKADVLSLHLPLITKKESKNPTWHYLSFEEFSMMQKQPYIINTSRGKVIDTGALVAALDAKKIKGAALDVIEDEPFKPGNPFYKALANKENVLLSPHYSSRTTQSFDFMAEQLVKGISYLLNGKPNDGLSYIANPDVLSAKK